MNDQPRETLASDMKTIHYFHVQTPEVSLTWIGGPLQADGDCVWLTKPNGEPVLRVRREWVTESTPEQTMERLTSDKIAEARRIQR
jgi:hypothetical protein